MNKKIKNRLKFDGEKDDSRYTTKEIIVKDDNNGNLYSTNAYHSQSSANSLSSSDNYVGNIFYDLGIAVLTETGSWSGSINYTDINNLAAATGAKAYMYWDLKFNSTTPIFTSQYSVKIPAGDFNRTMNYSTRNLLSASSAELPSGSYATDFINMRNELTGSNWSPYFTQIQLYRNQTEEPVIIANLPRAVKMRDDIDLIITFRIDN